MNVCCCGEKGFKFEKVVSKFLPKTFYEINPWSLFYITFLD